MDRGCGVAASLGDGIRCGGRSGSVESDTIHFVVGSLLGMKRGVSVGVDDEIDASSDITVGVLPSWRWFQRRPRILHGAVFPSLPEPLRSYLSEEAEMAEMTAGILTYPSGNVYF